MDWYAYTSNMLFENYFIYTYSFFFFIPKNIKGLNKPTISMSKTIGR